MNDKESATKLENLIHTMNLPWNRKKDFNSTKVRWLKKNMADMNSEHPNYDEAMRLVEKLIENG